ncbi:uncharacterized protein LAESUDRAFT_617409, partial [Laetiporus sulphureus 93-53]
YLVGIIPGPSKPSLNQVNHFLEPLIDDLLAFWDPGVFFSRTASYPKGRLVHCAVIPLVCDLPAARQVSGHGSYSASFFCSFCKLRLEDIENFDSNTWPKRDPMEHRKHAEEWRKANSYEARASIFKAHGVRWSQLLKLPYWDPIAFTVVDTMHNQYLGLIRTHCKEIWGMNIEVEDGDGMYVHARNVPPRPSDTDMQEGKHLLYGGSMSQLAKCTKAVLWHLCFEHDLRCARTKKQLLASLVHWVIDTSSAMDVTSKSNNSTSTLPMMEERVRKAEASLARGSQAKTLATHCKPALIAMCESRHLESTGVKAVLAERLITWNTHATAVDVSTLFCFFIKNYSRSNQPPRLSHEQHEEGKTRNASTVVLGRNTLAQVHADMEQTELPSWVSPAPCNFGTETRGKLHADQWLAACSINLPITLVRLWGKEQGRKQKMLQNFMDLLTAVTISSMLEISHQHIQIYERSLLRYLQTLRELYKEAVIKPNHHLALHVGESLRIFGPAHSTRTFSTERMNYLLMQTNTNGKFGELELTYMTHTCRAANLRALLRHDKIRGIMDEFMTCYDGIYNEDRRGTRLRESTTLDAQPQGIPGKNSKVTSLEKNQFMALLQLLNAEIGHDMYVDARDVRRTPGCQQLSNKGTNCPKIMIGGITYRPHNVAPKDSNIIFSSPHTAHTQAGRIINIFLHQHRDVHGKLVEESFVSIESLQELTELDRLSDPYSNFPGVGGKLYYNAYSSDINVVRPSNIISHFAKTPMEVQGIKRSCIHVLPLDRV